MLRDFEGNGRGSVIFLAKSQKKQGQIFSFSVFERWLVFFFFACGKMSEVQ